MLQNYRFMKLTIAVFTAFFSFGRKADRLLEECRLYSVQELR